MVSASRRAPGAGILISREGEQALQRELARLREEVEIQFPLRLRQAREFGEAADNDELLQIREEEGVLMARIVGLVRVLAEATVVDPSESSSGLASIGSLVTLRIGEKTVERRLLGSHEPMGSDGISAGSPIGSAILGRSAGEDTTAELPSGELRKIEILAVRPAIETSPELLSAAA